MSAPGCNAADALWWAYEHAPGALDPLFRLGRRHVLPMLRHGGEARRLTGAAGPDRSPATLVTTGASMTLDYLVARFFAAAPEAEALGRIARSGLAEQLDALAAHCDLLLACIPCTWGARLGPDYLRVPALIGASLRLGSDVEATLAAANQSVRADARLARSGYSWTFSSDLADFERFYDGFYVPFVRARFGALGSLRGRHELRREFRQGGGVIWIRHGGHRVAGQVVRPKGDVLHALVEAVDVTRESIGPKPGPQVAIKLATCELAHQRDLLEVDMGGSVPSLSNGVLRKKCGWGAAFAPWRESHRDILIRWRTPTPPPVTAFLRTVVPVFATPSGLAGLAADEPGADIGAWRQLRAPGIDPLLVMGAVERATGRSSGCVALAADLDAAAINRAARRTGER